jgi:cysteinyl-tRNA synthetase
MHTPEALAALSDLLSGAESTCIAPQAALSFKNFLEFLDRMFGLKLLASKDVTNEQKALIAKRETARAARDFAASDTLRQQLEAQNIVVRDTPLGTIWSRNK